ncbi:MAG TPA: twin-arginine translocation pathway signal [Bradyrhizobium sp.]|nr:twin-arginine translocation pathway signal [Bradyrhizobium sp.]
MTASMIRFISARRTAVALTLVLAGAGLSGCANMGDGPLSGAFVDPSIYDYYDCKQLETTRKTLTDRAAQLQALIDKADTGFGGAVVGEVAYRNDYITARAQLKLLEENWRRNKCVASPPAPTATSAPDHSSAKQKGAHSAARSLEAVH